MDHKQLIEKVILRDVTPKIPVAFWRHFPVDDQDPYSLAKSTTEFQKMFDFDFVKVSPPSSFCLKDWGAEDQWNGDPEGTRDYQGAVIQNPEDWQKLEILDPQKGHLGAQLECLKLIKSELPFDTPIIQTIFSPLSQAKNLAGKADILYQLRKYPDIFKIGLETITKTTQLFIEDCQKIGIDGVFFAVQHASYDLMTETEFIEFGKAYDSMFFEYIKSFWFNVLHIHGNNIMFDLVSEYPFQLFNWHDRETMPSLKDGLNKLKTAVCGGLSRINSMVHGNQQNIKTEFCDSLKQTNGRGFVLGTGCVLPLTTPLGNIFSAVQLAHGYKKE